MLNEVRIFELRIICSNSNSILKIRYSDPTCTKTGVGIEAWLLHNRLWTRRDVLVLCRPLHPSIDAAAVEAAVWLPLPAATHLSTFAVTPRSLLPLRLLRSAFADRYHALCNEANSSWYGSDWHPHWVDINERNSPHELSTYSGIFSFGIRLQLANRLAWEALL